MVARFDQLMVDFLQFSEGNQVDVIIDLPNFINTSMDNEKVEKDMIKKFTKLLSGLYYKEEPDESSGLFLTPDEKSFCLEAIMKSYDIVINERRKMKKFQNPKVFFLLA